MKLFLDTADVGAIESLYKTGLVDGVTTNPTHLSLAGGDPVLVIRRICDLLPGGAISVETTEHNPDRLHEQARAIAALSPNIVVKVPCHAMYYPVIKSLVSEHNIAINVTLVFSVLQGLYMAKLGVRYVSPFVGRLDDIDIDGMELVHQLRESFSGYGYQTQILAASLRHVRHMHDAIAAGADVLTVPPALLIKSMSHPLTDFGMAQFDADWKKLGITKFP